MSWGRDNRTCGIRVIGAGTGLRLEHRVPGADVNQYLAVAAIIAAGVYGIENKVELEPETRGNAYESSAPRIPLTLRDARDTFSGSARVRTLLGDEVVEHYAHHRLGEDARI
ncbi:hypothetical protein [Lysinibacter sp. HNR]|uniref:hypothetical protein n=1 Tax=Lysinibacter sp. HNR TaxID=3031408 RepID=UPI0024359FB8|nr:hypothetical protein [Lysinibacter sp. HNR]WGD38685.1 hypothetical protein FrondiHNR_12335 [Lysinibacter sp. HNR]